MKKIFLILSALPFFAFASGERFKIMSYNIRHGVTSDKGFDLSRAACVMAAEKPRFVALQEIDMYTDRVGRTNSCEVLARFMGEKHSCATNWNFAKAIDYGGGAYGVALLSEEKPLRVDKIALGGNEPRVLLMCEFDDCWVGVTHLPLGFVGGRIMNLTSHKPSFPIDDSDGEITADNVALAKERADLAREFNQISFDYMASVIKVEVLARAKTKPVFLAGDWNALPQSRFLTNVRKFMTVLTPENIPTFHGVIKKLPFTGKGKCIDYIAVDVNHADTYEIISSRVIDERLVSDHAPVVLEVKPHCVK